MENKIFIFLKLSGLLMLSSFIYSGDQNNFASSSCTPSTVSVGEDQVLKVEEEDDFEIISSQGAEEDYAKKWYCQIKFDATNSGSSYLKFFKSAIAGQKAQFYKISLCQLQEGKLAALYAMKSDLYRIKIFDVNSGKYLKSVDPLQDEKDSTLIPVSLCSLPKNRIACILNSSTGKNNKIKIYDISSGKLLKNITQENVANFSGQIRKEAYLANNKIALLLGELRTELCNFILIVDLETGKILNKLDLIKKEECDIFKDNSGLLVKPVDIFNQLNFSGLRIDKMCTLSNGCLLLKSGSKVAIISTETFEIDLIEEEVNIEDVCGLLENNEWSSLDYNCCLKHWTTDKFKFKPAKAILAEGNKLPIVDLQAIVLGYLTKKWSSKKIVSGDIIDPSDLASRHASNYILNNNNILSLTQDNLVKVINIKTGNGKDIDLGKRNLVGDKFAILDNGNKIAFCFSDGSIEIWSNQPCVSQ